MIFLRHAPRPVYARGFDGLGIGPPKLQRRRKAGHPANDAFAIFDSFVFTWSPAFAGDDDGTAGLGNPCQTGVRLIRSDPPAQGPVRSCATQMCSCSSVG